VSRRRVHLWTGRRTFPEGRADGRGQGSKSLFVHDGTRTILKYQPTPIDGRDEVAVRSFGGILTALVHKHAGATRKGFALILGLVLTGVTQSWIEGEKLSGDELTAMVLVILSSYLHLMYPPMAI